MASQVTFIGAGNMASAILGGMIDGGYPPQAITATSPSEAYLEPLQKKFAIRTLTDNRTAVADADVVVLAVKPQIMQDVCTDLRDTVQARRPLIVSVAAGLPAEALERWLGGNLPIVRCMPNTPSLVGSGACGLFANQHVSDDQRALASTLLDSVGLVEWVEDESLLDAVTAISGSGPAYFFLIFEALEAAGVRLGLPLESARRLALQTAAGAAHMAQQSDQSPEQLKRNVMSPGGTTEQAIYSLEDAGLRQAFLEATDACAKRAREMADELGNR
ncbi:pyrroline-5-carboxylate reductase [Aidingimonas lacisalsi]|uniref:pyrroline-5-carboxylate reductase n=1 Tax=Aidingimonas lacisalsi TaxID=2604086 RepID=UPI0011D1EC0B|nr:pyrroline-5-carboxylate reductase [Aidingimonas lacisalsi]